MVHNALSKKMALRLSETNVKGYRKRDAVVATYVGTIAKWFDLELLKNAVST